MTVYIVMKDELYDLDRVFVVHKVFAKRDDAVAYIEKKEAKLAKKLAKVEDRYKRREIQDDYVYIIREYKVQ